MKPIKAIQTRYKGYRFRSRLEARWAVFLDHAGLEWEYEPEGFELFDGTRYLPDFRISPLWFIEVKGQPIDDHDLLRAAMLSSALEVYVSVVQGMPGDCKVIGLGGKPLLREEALRWIVETHDTTPDQLRTRFSLAEEINRYYAFPEIPVVGNYAEVKHLSFREFFNDDNDSQIDDAVLAARSARFEFGESGAG